MKKTARTTYALFFIVALSFGSLAMALETANPGPPEFSGIAMGKQVGSITSFLQKNVRLPEGTDAFGLMGTAVVEFTVSASGEISNFNVINSLLPALDNEIIEALKQTNGNWKPGTQNGKAVSMKHEVSLVFKPNQNFDLTKIATNYTTKGNEKLLGDHDADKALKQYEKAVTLLPYECSFLAYRGLSKYELGDTQGGTEDFKRIAYIMKSGMAAFVLESLDPQAKSLKGYQALASALK
ncbi:MAG: energy transducer TonB [Bacteroidales bacterium]